MTATPVHEQVEHMIALAWAAGVLDANGNFTATFRKDMPHLLAPRITWRCPKVSAWPCSPELKKILGGTVGNIHGQPSGRAVWTISGARACLQADEQVLPFLRRQGRRVQLHAELCRRIVEYKAPSFSERLLPQEEVVERVRLFEAMSRL